MSLLDSLRKPSAFLSNSISEKNRFFRPFAKDSVIVNFGTSSFGDFYPIFFKNSVHFFDLPQIAIGTTHNDSSLDFFSSALNQPVQRTQCTFG